jgi:MalT-like TPR region/Caspase domain
MKFTIQALILILFFAVAGAGQVTDKDKDSSTAVVVGVKGVCLARDNENSESYRLKKKDLLWPGQQLQCAAKSSVKIAFRISAVQREITTSPPDWYLIPYPAVLVSKPIGLRLAGRAKGHADLQSGFTNTASVETSRNITAITRQPNDAFVLADLFWRGRQKYFLIVAASETPGINDHLPFTKIDAEKVSQGLSAVGYQKLDILDGQNATKKNFVSALKRIQSLPPNATVIVYYSGHAFADASKSDLSLQLFGRTQFGDEQGLAVNEIVRTARGETYRGELAIILDTCYSGQAVLTSKLSLKEAAGTAILTSSSDYQASYSVRLPDGVEMSVFTYFFLQALGDDWEEADTDHDGVIFYADVKRYINQQLLRTSAIPQLMEPQLSDNSNAWVAFNPRRARNSQTPTISALLSIQLRELQDPETTMSGLSNSNRDNADSYIQALMAIQDDKFDQAERLLTRAESERRVSIATVYWAHAVVRRRINDMVGARFWLEKALAATTVRNIDLMLAAASANGHVGNWARQRELMTAILEPPGNDDNNETIAAALFLSAFFDIFEGNPSEADRYVKRLKAVKPELLTNAITSAGPDFVEIMSEILSNNRDKAKHKIAEIRASLPMREISERENIKNLSDNLEKVFGLAEPRTLQTEITKAQLNTWATLLTNQDVPGVVSFLRNIIDSPWDRRTMVDSINSKEVGDLLDDTVAVANRLQFRNRRITTENQKFTNNDHQSVISRSGMLTAAADMYVARSDNSQAENLYKEVLQLTSQEIGAEETMIVAVMRLADLYVDNQRYGEAESLFLENITRVSASLGQQNVGVWSLYLRLGQVYERANRLEDAEKNYRFLVGITETKPNNIFGISSKETLAKTVFALGKYEEAVSLFEQVIRELELLEKHGQDWAADSLCEDYFIQGKSFYFLGRYGEAQIWLEKSYQLGLTRSPINLSDQFTTLLWQWATSMQTKKPTEAARSYQELIQLVRDNLARPEPDDRLGATLQDSGETFADWNELEKAEEVLRLANAIEKKRYGEDSLENADSLSTLGKLDFARGRYRTAISYYAAAKNIYEKRSPSPAVEVSYMLYMIGNANYLRLDFEQARSILKEAVRLLTQTPESSYGDNYSRELLAKVDILLGDFADAEKIANALLLEAQRSQPFDADGILSACLKLTSIARLRGLRDEADNLLKQSLKAASKIDQTELAEWPELDYERGMIAVMHDRPKEAAGFLRTAVQKAEKNRIDQPFLIECLESYGAIRAKMQKTQEAESIKARVRQIREALAAEREPMSRQH